MTLFARNHKNPSDHFLAVPGRDNWRKPDSHRHIYFIIAGNFAITLHCQASDGQDDDDDDDDAGLTN